MGFERKLKRNTLKKERKNKDIAKVWRWMRIKKIGLIAYVREYNRTTKNHLSPKEV